LLELGLSSFNLFPEGILRDLVFGSISLDRGLSEILKFLQRVLRGDHLFAFGLEMSDDLEKGFELFLRCEGWQRLGAGSSIVGE